jgi:DNA-binding response OmpR family regulator
MPAAVISGMITAMILWMILTMIVGLLFCLAAARPSPKGIPENDPRAETILAIDDDPELLHLAKLALEGEGYFVHAVTNPADGIRFYQQYRQSIGLVLLDFLMPKMNGDQVFAKLREIDPAVPVLLVTGCYDQIQTPALRNASGGYLPKPFRIETLIDRVHHQVLPQPAAG